MLQLVLYPEWRQWVHSYSLWKMRMCHAAQCAAFTGNLHNIGAWFGCNTNPGHKVPIITTCYQAVVLSCWHNGQSVNISQYNIPSCHLTRIPVMNLLADIMRANNSDVRWAAITTLPVCPIFVSNLYIILTLECTGANMVTALHIAMHNLSHLSHYTGEQNKKRRGCLEYSTWFHSIRSHRCLNEKPFFPLRSGFPAILGFWGDFWGSREKSSDF